MHKTTCQSTVLSVTDLTSDIFRLDCTWTGDSPRAGQFFMVKPGLTTVFLPRPISAAFWDKKKLGFLILRQGRGTEELAALHPGETLEISGPLGNAWADFLPAQTGAAKPMALVGGGVGIAPLLALAAELPEKSFDFFAGFRTGFKNSDERAGLLGSVESSAKNIIIAAEEDAGPGIRRGRIPDFLDPAEYAAVFACGPEAMLRAAAEKCAAGVPCYVSLERRMACGVGACLGCTVATSGGNRRCCADGPVFPASEIFF